MRVFNEHNNDIGDWCPFSGEELPLDQGRSRKCPQYCRASKVIDQDEDGPMNDDWLTSGQAITRLTEPDYNDHDQLLKDATLRNR